MTKFDNKFAVPQAPKTFQVLELRDQQQQVKKSNLSVAARSKVINRSGSNYLSESESYGPCESGGCSYSNAECQCYIGDLYVPMYLACPAPKYQPPYYCSDSSVGQWYHNNCGGRVFIDVNLNIKCMSCQTSGYVESWTFSCSSHPGKYEYASRSEFKSALGYLNNIWKNNFAGRTLIEAMIKKVIDRRSSFRHE